jgi:hypothetical protein
MIASDATRTGLGQAKDACGRIGRFAAALRVRRPMTTALDRLPAALAIAVMACGLCGCGTINGVLATGFEEVIPVWAGGLPSDAPPRPGTLKYDEWMKERERQRQEPAAKKEDSGTSAPASPSMEPVH